MARLNFSRRSDFNSFRVPERYAGSVRNKDEAVLKVYQDLYVYTFITRYIAKGGKVLEIGGGLSRLAGLLADEYEYWLLDKFEGRGNGPRMEPQLGNVKVVRDFIGEYSPHLPDDYFDCVFSVSVWEHFPKDEEALDNILLDIERVLHSHGVCVHCMDFVLRREGSEQDYFLEHLRRNIDFVSPFPDRQTLVSNPDLYVMSKHAYLQNWMPITQQSYESFGAPASLNFAYDKTQFKRRQIDHPKVSVITVTRNDLEGLKGTVESAAAQTHRNLEIIVVDGNSDDGTVSYLESLGGDVDCWLSEDDNGIYDAMNKGVRLASGEWVIFLNAGDAFYDKYVVARVYSEASADADLIYGNTEIIKENEEAVVVGARPLDTFWKQINFNHNALFCRRSLLLGRPFGAQYKIVSDSEFIGHCIREGKRFKHVNVTVNRYRLGGFSDQKSIQRTVERWKLMLDLGLADESDIHLAYAKRLLEDPRFLALLSLDESARVDNPAAAKSVLAKIDRLLRS